MSAGAFLKGISSGVETVANLLSPIGMAVDAVGSAIGLPPEAADIAKIGLGVLTANPIMVVGGVAGLIADIPDEAVTECPPPPPGAGPPQGYAPPGQPPPEHPGVVEYLRQAANNANEAVGGLAHAAIANTGGRTRVAHGWVDDAVAGANARGQAVADFFGGDSGGSVTRNITRDAPNPSSPLDPNISEYQEALGVLKANWWTYDSTVGARDEFITRDNLQAVVDNPKTSDPLKQAAQFLLGHPEYFNRLEMAAGYGGRDGVVGLGDVIAEQQRVGQEIAQYGLPVPLSPVPTPLLTIDAEVLGPDSRDDRGQSGGRADRPDRGAGVRSVINDPSMSLEEKIRTLMEGMISDIDDELYATMDQLDAAQRKDTQKLPKDQQQKAERERQADVDKLSRKLQTLLGRKQEMNAILSNVTATFHQMAMTAINNMRG